MAEALLRIEEIDKLRDTIYAESGLKDLDDEREKLESAVKSFVIAKGDYEDDGYKVTRVVAKRKWWDGERLEKLLPKGMFLKVVTLTPSPEKIDKLVKEGKLDRKVIAPAFMEVPNKPYALITRKSDNEDAGEAEAQSLADKLR